MIKKSIWCCLLALVVSCAPSKKKAEAVEYFSLSSYFEQEVARLNAKKPTVDKSVAINGRGENKSTNNIDWEKELHIFSEADINKASWRGLFKSSQTDSVETYASSNEKIPVKWIQIKKNNGIPFAIEIVVNRVNSIYRSADTLHYFPDSLYRIVKFQEKTLMTPERYTIVGRLK